MPQFNLEQKRLAEGLSALSRNLKRPIYPKVLTGMYREGIRVARQEYKRGLPRRTGETRRRALKGYVRKRRGYPYFATLGPLAERNRWGVRVHWTDQGTKPRVRLNGGSTGSIPAANYVGPLIRSFAPRVLNAMRDFAFGAAAQAQRKTAAIITSAVSRGRGR